MHALNAAVAALLDELLEAPPEDEDVLLPHAAASSATTLSAAAAQTVCLTVTSLFLSGLRRPHGPKAPSLRPAGEGTKIRKALLWDARRLDLPGRPGSQRAVRRPGRCQIETRPSCP